MIPTKYMVVSGFLGAGKTTSMIAMARMMNRKLAQSAASATDDTPTTSHTSATDDTSTTSDTSTAPRASDTTTPHQDTTTSEHPHAAIIANDLGAKNLVDADFTRTTDIAVTEITGDCICYVTEDLVDRIDRLAANGAAIVMSDIPGSGVGALDHVYIKLKETYPNKYDLLPLTCIVDPVRLRMILPERATINLPEEMRFLLNAQLAEADLIVLNKIDLLDEDELAADLDFIRTAYPDIPLMAMSARTGEGIEEVVDYLLSHRAAALHRDIGMQSEEFDLAEAQMCWYNRRFFAKENSGANINFNHVVRDLMEEIRDGLIEVKRNVPHLKVFAAGEGNDFIKASLLGVDYDIEYESTLKHDYTAMALIVNARAVCESETMGEIADTALDVIKQRYNLTCNIIFTECFGFADEGRRNGGRASRY